MWASSRLHPFFFQGPVRIVQVAQLTVGPQRPIWTVPDLVDNRS